MRRVRPAYNSAHAGIAQLVEQLICNQKVAGSIPAAGTSDFTGSPHLRRSRRRKREMLRQLPVLVMVLLAAEVGAQSSAPATLDQAQQRIQHAREQLVTAERRARDADRKEKNAYRQIELAQQRLDEAQRGYEESKQRAEQATQALREAQAEVDKARERYQQEYQYLQEIHRAGGSQSPPPPR